MQLLRRPEPRIAEKVAPSRTKRPSRGLLFALLCGLCLAVLVGYAALALRRDQERSGAVVEVPIDSPAGSAALGKGPDLVFANQDGGEYNGKVTLVPLAAMNGPRFVTTQTCDRVDIAIGQALCLGRANSPFSIATAFVLDSNFRPVYSFPLSGLPSRARLSPDGRFGAVTVFVAGDSYATDSFSTRTTLIDVTNRTIIGDLEQFAITRDNQPFKSTDFNFWGVTFANDGARFYATLASGGIPYLIEGDVATRTARVIYSNVECPSLSRDQTRIAFKKASEIDGNRRWRLTVLNLRTFSETPLAEVRRVDDQATWLDNEHLLYGLANDDKPPTGKTDVWEVSADGFGTPQPILRGAYSPTVRR